jgi:hypothetical protein
LLRLSIKIRKAGRRGARGAGFFEGETVAHCEPTLKGGVCSTASIRPPVPSQTTPADKANPRSTGLDGGDSLPVAAYAR